MQDLQIERRRQRALEPGYAIRNLGSHPVFSSFEIDSPSGRTYRVTLRSVRDRVNSCTCADYQSNLLGTCKHIEAVLARATRGHRRRLDRLEREAPATAEVFLSYGERVDVRLRSPGGLRGPLRSLVRGHFDDAGRFVGDPATRLPALLDEVALLPAELAAGLRVSPEVSAHARLLADGAEHRRQREWFLREVAEGRRSLDLLGTRLYPYQVEGVLHLAFTGRALLADDMGLGKTVQALAAALLLRELRGIQRVLIVTPASLKHQWLREIRRFTSLPAEVVGGPAGKRDLAYRTPAFFTIVNYELLLRDADVFERLNCDLVILDEAQRAKNWRTKTAQAVKRLKSRYAFILSGTPLENNLDELYSVFQTLDPRLLGPLWQFNERFFSLATRKSGSYKVLGYKNLAELRERIRPVLLRRTRDEVLKDLPARVDNNFFVPVTPEQMKPYGDYLAVVAQLLNLAERRPLTPAETKNLLAALQKLRILCNALELHDPRIPEALKRKTAPKLDELARILQEQVVEGGRKAILFSSFEGMIDLAIRRVVRPLEIGHVKFAGSVPSARRGALLDRFREDPACKLFLSTDAGGVGLNLQEASLVVNLDIPWNPAVLEQRIGRAHRMGQKQSVQVINLVAQGAIEERMLDTLAQKRQVFQAVFGALDAADAVAFGRDRSLLGRLQQLVGTATTSPAAGTGDAAERAMAAPERAVADAAPALDLPAAAADPAAPASNSAADPGASPDAAATPSSPCPLPAAAPAPEASVGDAVRSFAARLAGRLPGRVLLVQRVHAPAAAVATATEAPRLLVVVDRDAGALTEMVEELAASAGGGTPAFTVHLLDRAGYETLLAVAGPGFGRAGRNGGSSTEELHRAPALPAPAGADAEAAAVAERTRAVKSALERGDERLRLARLMAGGGFSADALAPMGAALDAALDALYGLAGGAVPADPAAALAVEERLVRPGLLEQEDAARIPWLRELLGGAPSADALAADAVLVGRVSGAIERLVEAARLRLTERSL
ncbi:MAG: DEAD/DEAH box helicase [Planctomycetes bacterium]|nr:DEAD/DEAH box helicase [Planctomycetota bacterium]